MKILDHTGKVMKSQQPKERLIICTPGKQFSGKFLEYWTKLILGLTYENYQVTINTTYAPNIYIVRNNLLGGFWKYGPKQTPFNGKVPYDYIIMFDSDQIITCDHVIQLVDQKKNIIAGWTSVANGLETNVCRKEDKDFYKKEGRWPLMSIDQMMLKDKPFKCSYTGFALMCIKKGVFESINYPWFEPLREGAGSPNGIVSTIVSEDRSFCLKAKEAGHSIWIDPKIRVGHEKTYTI